MVACVGDLGGGEMTVRIEQRQASRDADVVGRRPLSGEKATRIVEAMSESVGEVGIAGSTFERVAAKAGVSRGLLHYYFGTKERLVIEVVRRESRARMDMLEVPLGDAQTVDDVIDALVAGAENLARERPSFYALLFELVAAGNRNPEVRRELAELYDTARRRVSEALRKKDAEGVLRLRYEAETVVSYLFAAIDGAVLQRLADPALRIGAANDLGVGVSRFLLDARA